MYTNLITELFKYAVIRIRSRDCILPWPQIIVPNHNLKIDAKIMWVTSYGSAYRAGYLILHFMYFEIEKNENVSVN